MTNERFMEWMRAPLRSTFYKLWGKINEDLHKGIYTVEIQNGRLY